MTDQPRDERQTREVPLPGPAPRPDQTRPDVPPPPPYQGPPPQYQGPPYQGPPPPQSQGPDAPASDENWHRLHYPIGFFLVAYGVTTLLVSLLGWSAHREGIEEYLGAGVAGPALIVVKVAEALLVLIALAGLLRRRDVWFLPGLVGWLAGFGVFCVLDVAKGKLERLPEHAGFLVVFAVLLFLSYALGVKARVGRERPAATPQPSGKPGGLSRTQEIALAALNRWQRGPGPQVPQQQQQPFPPPQQYGGPR